jgi:hypothetical protein
VQWFRRRFPAFLAVWLLGQLAGAGMPVVLMATGIPLEESIVEQCTCPIGDHATCPMHGAAEATPEESEEGERHCTLRNACSTPDAALLSFSGGIGELTPRADFHVVLQQTATLDAFTATALSYSELPDAPPPRG